MARREMTLERYQEIKRLLDNGLSVSKISKSLNCCRKTVRKVRDGVLSKSAIGIRNTSCPLWVKQVNWGQVLKDLKVGDHPLKYIWEEQALDLINYSGFWKQFNKLYPDYHKRFVTHRFFSPGDYCEVDYAGSVVEYVVRRTGEVRKANIFIGILCHSQLVFAYAQGNMQSRCFLECHSKMYEYFGGVPHVTVCDNLRQGVSKSHIYDPDINQAYRDLAKHYDTAIVPARVRKPKDKALVEGAVKIIMRYFKFMYRNHIFFSISEINKALAIVIEKINNKEHSRFKTSRFNLWREYEKKNLKILPLESYEHHEWKTCKVHPDSHILVQNNYYSVPHIHRGKKAKVKVSKNFVEIFVDTQRVAKHSRDFLKRGTVVTDINHLPENAKAYHEGTPQNLLSQARFISEDLYLLFFEHFKDNALGNLRRAQGIIYAAKKELEESGRDKARLIIASVCSDVRLFKKFRVPYFKDQLKYYRAKDYTQSYKNIERTENPMLRYQ